MAERLLVTGASSAIGEYLLPRLAGAGYGVVALSRVPQPTAGPVNWLLGDLTDEALALPLQEIEALIHLAPIWLLPGWLEKIRSRTGLRRLIAFSSTSRWSKMESASPGERQLARTLAAAEAEVIAWSEKHGVSWTILRPTLIYGAGRDRNVCALARWIRQWRVFPLLGEGGGRRQPVHAEDLAAACVQVLAAPRAAARSYDLSGGETLTYREMVGRIFDALHMQRRFLTVPEWLALSFLRLLGRVPGWGGVSPEAVRRMGSDLCFDHGQAAEDFGYRPRPFFPQPRELGLPR